MAVKTITIDLEAYGLLARRKAAGQSFSQVIKAHFTPQPTVGAFRASARSVRITPAALDRMEQVASDRRKSPARAAAR